MPEHRDDWKHEVFGHAAIDFLSRSPESLPKFNEHKWIISAAVLAKGRMWRSKNQFVIESDENFRSLLLMQKTGKNKNWGLPEGEVKAVDLNITNAVERVVLETCGLHVSAILGAITPVILLDDPAWTTARVKLVFAVAVEEEKSSSAAEFIAITSGFGYRDHRWAQTIRQVDSLRPLSHQHKPLLHYARTFREELWHSLVEYLPMALSTLRYQDRYNYILLAAIIRPSSTGNPPAILLVSKENPNEPGSPVWELQVAG